MNNKVIFLDFDGVLFDTLREVYLISRYIYCQTPFLNAIDEENYAVFSKYKYLVYNIWMFYYFNPLIFAKKQENNIVADYKKALEARNIELENKFCYEFLEARRKLVNNHFDFWKNLEIPYDFFYKIKEVYDKGNNNIVIVSKKNKNSILERFKTYNFDLDPNFVYAREALDSYPSKGDFINEYMKKNNYTDAIFVDDNINNLKSVQSKNVKTLLALWGNTGPQDAGYNQNEAISVIYDYLISK